MNFHLSAVEKMYYEVWGSDSLLLVSQADSPAPKLTPLVEPVVDISGRSIWQINVLCFILLEVY